MILRIKGIDALATLKDLQAEIADNVPRTVLNNIFCL